MIDFSAIVEKSKKKREELAAQSRAFITEWVAKNLEATLESGANKGSLRVAIMENEEKNELFDPNFLKRYLMDQGIPCFIELGTVYVDLKPPSGVAYQMQTSGFDLQ